MKSKFLLTSEKTFLLKRCDQNTSIIEISAWSAFEPWVIRLVRGLDFLKNAWWVNWYNVTKNHTSKWVFQRCRRRRTIIGMNSDEQTHPIVNPNLLVSVFLRLLVCDNTKIFFVSFVFLSGGNWSFKFAKLVERTVTNSTFTLVLGDKNTTKRLLYSVIPRINAAIFRIVLRWESLRALSF